MLKKSASLPGNSIPFGHCMTTSFGLFELPSTFEFPQPMAYYREGGITPHLRFVLRSLALY